MLKMLMKTTMACTHTPNRWRIKSERLCVEERVRMRDGVCELGNVRVMGEWLRAGVCERIGVFELVRGSPGPRTQRGV